MTKKGLIALDIDGTLTHRLDWISDKVVHRLESLVQEGWDIALLTGRMFSFAWKILQYFKFPYLLAVQNGADIVEMPHKTVVKRNYLPSEILPKIEEAYHGQKEDFVIYAGMDLGDFCYFRQKRFSQKAREYLAILESHGAPWQESDFVFDEKQAFPLIKCFGENEGMTKLNQKLKQIPQIEVSLNHDPVEPSYYLNLITHPKANKGEALNTFRMLYQDYFVIAAGDDQNDQKMLKRADISIAMDRGPETIEGDILAKPARDLGILEALEKAINKARRSKNE